MIVNLGREEKWIRLTSLKDFSEDLTINLNKKGARVIVAGMLTAKKDDLVKFNIEVNHNAPETFSDVLIRSVLYDRSNVDLRGMVRIAPGAKGSNTFLKEDALMMSSDAQAFALPSLEILENEVKAGHSSVVGPIDLEQLFYLQSRGIGLELAEEMLVTGYLYPVKQKFGGRFD